MFKNFLTHQIAQGFDRACASLVVEDARQKNELLRCSRSMIHYLNRSVHTQDATEYQKFLFVSLTYLRDCRETLDALQLSEFEIRGRYEVLHARLEQLCWDAALTENGQLRMFG